MSYIIIYIKSPKQAPIAMIVTYDGLPCPVLFDYISYNCKEYAEVKNPFASDMISLVYNYNTHNVGVSSRLMTVCLVYHTCGDNSNISAVQHLLIFQSL